MPADVFFARIEDPGSRPFVSGLQRGEIFLPSVVHNARLSLVIATLSLFGLIEEMMKETRPLLIILIT